MNVSPSSDRPGTDEEIDLHQLAITLWRQKAFIVKIVIFGAVLGAGAGLYSTRYVTEGLFLVPGMAANNYKKYHAAFSNGMHLQQYLRDTGQTATAEGRLLSELAENPDRFAAAFVPEFALTDRSGKILGVRTKNDDPGDLIGIRIIFSNKYPVGGLPVSILAGYVGNNVIRINMESILLEQCNHLRLRAQQLRNEQINGNFSIRREQSRAASLRDIISRNPDINIVDNRQIISVEKDTERFLPPVAQLIIAEIKIVDMKLAERERERERAASSIKRDYYCDAKLALEKKALSTEFLDELKTIQTKAFDGQDKSVDIVEQTWNELDVERENWLNTYHGKMRFVVSPEDSEVKQRKLGVALGAVLGGMLGALLALVLGWWRSNGKNIAENPDT